MKTLKDFTTKEDFYSYLITNKKELIEFKRLTMKVADAFGTAESQAATVKALNTSYKDDVASGVIKRTIIGNTYNWMDSHDDVHLDNVFAQSISQRQDKIFHLHDHEQKITAKVGKPTSIYEKSVAWKDLGVDRPGNTMALFMDSNIIKEYNPTIFNAYLNKEINQHSVGMIYVKIDLAVNDINQKEEFATFSKYINQIGNKEKVLEQGYFWAVSEAKLIEISCVLAGSNELTDTVDNTPKAEVPKCDFYERLAKQLASC